MEEFIEKILAAMLGGAIFVVGLIFFLIAIVAWFFAATMNTVYFFAPIAVVAMGVGAFLFFEGIFIEKLSSFSRKLLKIVEGIIDFVPHR